MRAMFSALALLVGACATVPAPGAGESVERLTYETGPCFGACPVYRVTVGRDGTGRFEGTRFTAVAGIRSFRVTPARFEAFARHLAPLRPSRGEVRYAGESCSMTATDLPSAEVTWEGEGGDRQLLYFYYGCDMERNRAIAERLSAAPSLLPIGDFIGPNR
jgi:Domain of unknown function (DUF6438)